MGRRIRQVVCASAWLTRQTFVFVVLSSDRRQTLRRLDWFALQTTPSENSGTPTEYIMQLVPGKKLRAWTTTSPDANGLPENIVRVCPAMSAATKHNILFFYFHIFREIQFD